MSFHRMFGKTFMNRTKAELEAENERMKLALQASLEMIKIAETALRPRQLASEIRTSANGLSDEARDRLLKKGMSIIYGGDNKS